MARAPRPWKVLPHEPLQKHEVNFWSVLGHLRPGGTMNRRMALARLGDGRIVCYNAVPLDEAAMAEVEAWGKPAFLIVPSGYHRLDIHAFKARYPGMKLLAPAAIAARVGQVAAVDGDLALVPADDAVRVEALEGTKIGEPVLIVRTGERHSVMLGDAMMNLAHGKGGEGFVFKLLGTTGGPKVPPIAKLFLMSDRARFRAGLERIAALPGLARVMPSHGEGVDAETLKKVAATLG